MRLVNDCCATNVSKLMIKSDWSTIVQLTCIVIAVDDELGHDYIIGVVFTVSVTASNLASLLPHQLDEVGVRLESIGVTFVKGLIVQRVCVVPDLLVPLIHSVVCLCAHVGVFSEKGRNVFNVPQILTHPVVFIKRLSVEIVA